MRIYNPFALLRAVLASALETFGLVTALLLVALWVFRWWILALILIVHFW